MYVYVGFLAREIRDKIDFETSMFQISTWISPLERSYYVLSHRSYLRQILRLIQKNIVGYSSGSMKFDVFKEEIIIDSPETLDSIKDAEIHANTYRVDPIEYLKKVAAALDSELSKKNRVIRQRTE